MKRIICELHRGKGGIEPRPRGVKNSPGLCVVRGEKGLVLAWGDSGRKKRDNIPKRMGKKKRLPGTMNWVWQENAP